MILDVVYSTSFGKVTSPYVLASQKSFYPPHRIQILKLENESKTKMHPATQTDVKEQRRRTNLAKPSSRTTFATNFSSSTRERLYNVVVSRNDANNASRSGELCRSGTAAVGPVSAVAAAGDGGI